MRAELEWLVVSALLLLASSCSDAGGPSGMTRAEVALCESVSMQSQEELDALDFGRALHPPIDTFATLTIDDIEQRSELAIIGSVRNLREGRALRRVGAGPTGFHDYSVVAEFSVDSHLVGDDSLDPVYVEFIGHPDWSRDRLLSCTSVPDEKYLLFLREADSDVAQELSEDLEYVGNGTGHPEGTPLFRTASVEAMFVGGEDRLVPVASPETDPFEGAATTLDELLPPNAL
jgi:hypothetical protein